MPISRDQIRNRLLANLSAADFALLAPMLTAIELPVRTVLQSRGRTITHLYFLDTGIASMVVSAGHTHTIEVGVIGREGVTGVSFILGADQSPIDVFMQAAGAGWRLTTDDLTAAMQESLSLRALLVLFAHTLMVQMSFTALSDGRYKVEERLARWLLMAQDRMDGNVITLTHEFLSVMLGVRRPGVTGAMNLLERRGSISTTRGVITVADRDALVRDANGGYGAPEAEYERYFRN